MNKDLFKSLIEARKIAFNRWIKDPLNPEKEELLKIIRTAIDTYLQR